MYMHSILVTANYEENEFLFRCMSIEKTRGGIWRAWLGNDNEFSLVVEFKKGVDMVDFISSELSSYEEKNFMDGGELNQIVKGMW